MMKPKSMFKNKNNGSLLLQFLLVMAVMAIVVAIMFLDLSKFKLKNKKNIPTPIEDLVKKIEQDGALLALDRTDTLAGIDDNNNGIRDDIDAYIHKIFTDDKQRKVVEQLARSLQATLFVDLNNEKDIILARENATKSIGCIFNQFDAFDKDSYFMDEIMKRTFNTKKQVTANLNFDEALSGNVRGLHEGDVCNE